MADGGGEDRTEDEELRGAEGGEGQWSHRPTYRPSTPPRKHRECGSDVLVRYSGSERDCFERGSHSVPDRHCPGSEPWAEDVTGGAPFSRLTRTSSAGKRRHFYSKSRKSASLKPGKRRMLIQPHYRSRPLDGLVTSTPAG